MYTYKATVTKVVDGDTVHATVDLGFDQYTNKTLRLAGINAPEMSTPEGIVAKDYLDNILGQADYQILISTLKDRREKYGRYLATLYINDLDVNQLMIDDGMAVVYK